MTKVPEEVNRKQTIINQARVKVEFKIIQSQELRKVLFSLNNLKMYQLINLSQRNRKSLIDNKFT